MVSMKKSSKTIYDHNAHAFAPGHITGFFQPVYHPDNVLLTGSRGAGLSVSLGCHSQVSIQEAEDASVEIVTDNKQDDNPLVHRCIECLLQDHTYQIQVNNTLELPVGQGFGMSAAACLAVSFALSECLHLPLRNALYAAHQAEVELQTGLGDVSAAFAGGIEIRKEPGVISEKAIQQIPGCPNVVLGVIDSSIKTEQILSDKIKMKKITNLGKICTDELLTHPTIDHFFSLAQRFTKDSGLASDKILQAIAEANIPGMASMCMLGNAVFAQGTVKELVRILKQFGSVYQTRVDIVGTRLI